MTQVPGNPTPPLTPNNTTGHCVSAPFASPVSDPGSGAGASPNPANSQDTKPNFSLASK